MYQYTERLNRVANIAISLLLLGLLLSVGCNSDQTSTETNVAEAEQPQTDLSTSTDASSSDSPASDNASTLDTSTTPVAAATNDSSTIDASTSNTSATDDISTSDTSKTPSQSMGKMKMMPMPSNPADIVFKDKVESNVIAPNALSQVSFRDIDGNKIQLKSYLGKKNVVLVFTEGFTGMLCPFCKTQTSRLVANYEKFRERDTEIIVVYPGTRDHLDEFVEAARKTEKDEVDSVPFPLVLDEDLKAVSFFRINSNLAHPSTFIINKKGDIRLAYVGADMSADRPSVSAILSILDDSAN